MLRPRFQRSRALLQRNLVEAHAAVTAAEADLAAAQARMDRALTELHDETDLSLRTIGALVGWSHTGVAKAIERHREDLSP